VSRLAALATSARADLRHAVVTARARAHHLCRRQAPAPGGRPWRLSRVRGFACPDRLLPCNTSIAGAEAGGAAEEQQRSRTLEPPPQPSPALHYTDLPPLHPQSLRLDPRPLSNSHALVLALPDGCHVCFDLLSELPRLHVSRPHPLSAPPLPAPPRPKAVAMADARPLALDQHSIPRHTCIPRRLPHLRPCRPPPRTTLTPSACHTPSTRHLSLLTADQCLAR